MRVSCPYAFLTSLLLEPESSLSVRTEKKLTLFADSKAETSIGASSLMSSSRASNWDFRERICLRMIGWRFWKQQENSSFESEKRNEFSQGLSFPDERNFRGELTLWALRVFSAFCLSLRTAMSLLSAALSWLLKDWISSATALDHRTARRKRRAKRWESENLLIREREERIFQLTSADLKCLYSI